MRFDDKYEFERRLKLFGEYTRGDLKRAFKRAAKACHPDIARFHGLPANLAEENMKRVNEAFSALSSLFNSQPNVESITADYSPEGDQVQDGFFIYDDELYPGAQIQFGRYPFNQDRSFSPLIWYAIDVQDDFATLITDQCIDCRPFNNTPGPIDWSRSDLRAWLNTVFVERAFNADEMQAIETTKLINSLPNKYGISGGKDTTDKVYLLSVDEARTLFESWRELATTVTDFAFERGSFRNDDYRGYWWLRSPGRVPDAVAYIAPDGYIHHYDGRSSTAGNYSVRPVVRVRLKKRSHNQLERDAARARKKTADDKERASRTAKAEAARAAKANEEQAEADRAAEEERAARERGYSPTAKIESVGAVVSMGRYPDNSPIYWNVIDIKHDATLLVSSKAIAQKPFAYDATKVRWPDSLLRKWLHEDFLTNFFNPEERSSIIQTFVGQSGSNCSDRVFCLSKEEVEKYFPDSQARIVCASTWTVANEATSPGPIAWWLRTPGTFGKSFVVAVLGSGKVIDMGLSCSEAGVGVRPAIWVRR